jgi:Na/Pi-cotransporter
MIKGIKLFFAIQLLLFTGVLANTDSTSAVDFKFTSDIFQNVTAKGGEESAKLSWGIDHDAYAALKAMDAKLIITYNTKIGKKRAKQGIEGGDWMYTSVIDLDKTSFEIDNLVGYESYYFKIGVAPNENIEKVKDDKEKMIWSSEAKTKTERSWGIAKLLMLIGALGFFIYGMKVMSEGLQQAAGNKLRGMLGSITSNRVKGVLTGFGITSIVQSSSVTTVMTVSFVNAGLMTLRQSAGVMMGANIGTTITGWLVLILGFKVSISSYAYMIIAIATPLLFIAKGKSRAWASAIFGFCILFIGLDVLKDTVPSLDASSSIVQFFIDFKDVWYGPVMFVLLGALVTIVIQSSSAAMALTLAMVSAGTIPFEVACAMVLGENIGTTITAEIASLIANVHAKRSARIHSMFNIVGVVWMLLVFPLFLKGLASIVDGDPFTDVAAAGTTIALFHTSFNLINVLLLIWFVPQLVRLAEKTVKSKGESDEEFKLDFIDGPLGSTAELCILEATKEVAKFGKITAKMNGFVKTYVNSSEKKVKNKMLDKLEKYEEITDRVEVEIADYLGETARLEMSDEASIQMRSMLNISTDLERIGDIFFQMSKALEKKDRDKNYFTPEQREGINKMIAVTEEAFAIMNENLRSEYGTISLDKANAKEKEINALRDKLRRQHLKTIESTDFNMNSALIYSNIFSSFEKVGDHIINVSEAVAGEI